MATDDDPNTLALSRRTLLGSAALFGGALSVGYMMTRESGTESATMDDPVTVGKGSYTRTPPEGIDEPPEPVSVGSDIDAPIPTNSWWSSLLWDDFSENLFAHPLVARATQRGLAVGCPDEWIFTQEQDLEQATAMMDVEMDLTIGVPDTAVDGVQAEQWSDWSVQASLRDDGQTTLRATLTQGCPFVYADSAEGVELSFEAMPEVTESGHLLRVTHNGTTYGVFAPDGATWEGLDSQTLTSDLAGEGYFAIAVLPADSDEALSTYREYAYNPITDTAVAWEYDEADATVDVEFTFDTEQRPESTTDGVLTTLYPHQWKYSDATTADWHYRTQRGEQRVYTGTSFTVTYPYRGTLPSLPDVDHYSHEELEAYVQEVADEETLIRPGLEGAGDDTYWTGKNFERLVQLLPIADAVGATDASDRFERAIREELEKWLDASDADEEDSTDLFYYNDEWGTLIGYPDSHGSATALNDHHFHYGYYVKAAAAIARRDPEWADEDAWGGIVDHLVRDFAGYDREDDQYPFLRNHDVYAGHSWASGNAMFEDGNNQESSSEALNAYSAMIEWGAYTGNTALRDAGIYLYTSELHAVHEYWFDRDGDSHPPEWNHDYSANVWGNGYWYNTWWTTDIEAIHGINFMPLGAYSHHLGWDDDHAAENYQDIVDMRGGDDFSYYPDLMWMYRAFSDSQDALELWEAGKDEYSAEFGMSRAQTYYWLTTLDAIGSPEPSITADHSLYTVFSTSEGAITYAAYNPTDSSISVSFSDGTILEVEPNSLGVTRSG